MGDTLKLCGFGNGSVLHQAQLLMSSLCILLRQAFAACLSMHLAVVSCSTIENTVVLSKSDPSVTEQLYRMLHILNHVRPLHYRCC